VFEVVERPDPVPGPGQVLVDVQAAHTLWVETAIRSGAGQDYWSMRPPYVPGNAVSGRESRVGPDVDNARLGRRVAGHTGNEGGYADRALVAADRLCVVPDTQSFRLWISALLRCGVDPQDTLWEVVCRTDRDVVEQAQCRGPVVEERGRGGQVEVVGASGGLGIVSVQLGRARARRVVALARAAKLARVQELKPDAVVDSDDPHWAQQARAELGGGADVVLDNVGGGLGEAAFALAVTGGRFSAHGTPSGRFAQIDRDEARRTRVAVTGIEAVQLPAPDLTRYTRAALVEAAVGNIAPVVGQTFALERVGEAHAAIEGRAVFGTTLLVM
jgi:NADPH2:quinone reductase